MKWLVADHCAVVSGTAIVEANTRRCYSPATRIKTASMWKLSKDAVPILIRAFHAAVVVPVNHHLGFTLEVGVKAIVTDVAG